MARPPPYVLEMTLSWGRGCPGDQPGSLALLSPLSDPCPPLPLPNADTHPSGSSLPSTTKWLVVKHSLSCFYPGNFMTSNLLGRREKLPYVLAPEFKTLEGSHLKKEMACPSTCQIWKKSMRRVTWSSQLAWGLAQLGHWLLLTGLSHSIPPTCPPGGTQVRIGRQVLAD